MSDDQNKVKIHSKTVNADGSTTVVTSSKLPKWFLENRPPRGQEIIDELLDSIEVSKMMIECYEKWSDEASVKRVARFKETLAILEARLAKAEREINGKR